MASERYSRVDESEEDNAETPHIRLEVACLGLYHLRGHEADRADLVNGAFIFFKFAS